MAEKVIFEYVAGEDDKRARRKIKVKVKTRSPWPGGFINPLFFSAAGRHPRHCGGARSHGWRSGKKTLRRQLDAFERMYRELYQEDST